MMDSYGIEELAHLKYHLMICGGCESLNLKYAILLGRFGRRAMASIGFTGTQQGMTEEQKKSLRALLDGGAGELHHGDCIGADAEAHDIADECGYATILHPPTNYSKRAWREVPKHMARPEKAYFDRNKDIVLETAALIAAPAEPEEQLRPDSGPTVRFKKKQGKPVFVILPDGTVKR